MEWARVARRSLRLAGPVAIGALVLALSRQVAETAGLPPLGRILLPTLACLPVYLLALLATDADLRRWATARWPAVAKP